MNAQEHASAIEAAVKAAEADGYFFGLENRCVGCCSDFEATVYKSVRGDQGWEIVEHAEVNI